MSPVDFPRPRSQQWFRAGFTEIIAGSAAAEPAVSRLVARRVRTPPKPGFAAAEPAVSGLVARQDPCHSETHTRKNSIGGTGAMRSRELDMRSRERGSPKRGHHTIEGHPKHRLKLSILVLFFLVGALPVRCLLLQMSEFDMDFESRV